MFFCLFAISIFSVTHGAVNEFNKLNVVQVNMSDVVYKKLMTTKNNVFSATPLSILDVSLFQKNLCYQNIRNNIWSIGIPIIFWDESYMNKISKSIQQNNQINNFTFDKVSVLPPSDIVAYRINWRRGSTNGRNEDNISLDSSWYDAQTDYVLPMRQYFIMEFNNASHESKTLCYKTKEKLLNETLQSQELIIEFRKKIVKSITNININVTLKDVWSVESYNESECEEKLENECYISRDYAKKWAYDVSSKIIKMTDMVHLNLQKDIYDIVYEYLCRKQIFMFKLELKSVKRLTKRVDNEMVCRVPSKLYKSSKSPCGIRYDYFGNRIGCYNNILADENEVISSIHPLLFNDDDKEFSIPVTKL